MQQFEIEKDKGNKNSKICCQPVCDIVNYIGRAIQKNPVMFIAGLVSAVGLYVLFRPGVVLGIVTLGWALGNQKFWPEKVTKFCEHAHEKYSPWIVLATAVSLFYILESCLIPAMVGGAAAFIRKQGEKPKY